ncbi:hypothetical protein P3X46_016567 [Hevea brasiliensis]|uniref:RNase H type-1 domain-containing protein n=1 Tax=Hevea brasiliensis TaxID=3981 RepID=A0ABQ9LZN3_HEVBR|nr:hypothetical protein P3X46_016567 [Hevea brasiliensis]
MGFTPPKAEILLWFVCRNRLCCRDWLSNIGIIPQSQNVCPFHLRYEETIPHLFLQYEFSWKVWSWFLKWRECSFYIPGTMWKFFYQCSSTDLGNFQTVFWMNPFFAITWSLRLKRNGRVFNSNESSIVALCSLILHRLSIWMKANNVDFPFSGLDLLVSSEYIKSWTNVSKQRPLALWSAPLGSSLEWNVDGSSRGKPGESGMGGVVRNVDGSFLCVFSCALGVMESNRAELLAIVNALKLSI